jgi:hypothetical protein
MITIDLKVGVDRAKIQRDLEEEGVMYAEGLSHEIAGHVSKHLREAIDLAIETVLKHGELFYNMNLRSAAEASNTVMENKEAINEALMRGDFAQIIDIANRRRH